MQLPSVLFIVMLVCVLSGIVMTNLGLNRSLSDVRQQHLYIHRELSKIVDNRPSERVEERRSSDEAASLVEASTLIKPTTPTRADVAMRMRLRREIARLRWQLARNSFKVSDLSVNHRRFTLEDLLKLVHHWDSTKIRCGLLASIVDNRVHYSLVPKRCRDNPAFLGSDIYYQHTITSLSALCARVSLPNVTFLIKFCDGCDKSYMFPKGGNAPVLSLNFGQPPECDEHQRNIVFPSYDWYFDTMGANGFQPRAKHRFDSLVLLPWEDRVPKAVWAGDTAYKKGSGMERRGLVQFGQNRTDLMTVAASDCEALGARPPCPYISSEDVMRHKYLIDIDGHGVTFRLKNLLLSGSVVMKVSSAGDMMEFWMTQLRPWVHYIPVDHTRLAASLQERIAWARAHDAACRNMAETARSFALNSLTFELMHKFQADTLWAYSKLQDFTPPTELPKTWGIELRVAPRTNVYGEK